MVERYYACRSCLNRKVRVYTANGQTYEGVVTDVDRYHLYLQVEQGGEVQTQGWFGARNQILTLVLFDLLAISLLV
ncbi:hypothetical protein [Paenibacillus sp. J2TS4]|uniref:hypothetical protein n=1 Tax=Paenibacillus sp. J2TS4 TaxID=2807194 RepID=UPI001B0B8AEE|nr:hypothetical protein [Paenibacillus sp. J2TS4]GIP33042.1 hypothetical protein J2TS4_22520 [Paenibacillus sp. J2TS4]